jgi:hypothetical protein
MALNIDAPMGLRAVKGEYNAAPKLEVFEALVSTTFYEGEPVCIAASGVIVPYTDARALEGGVIGVCNHPLSSSATDRAMEVYSDPLQVFEIQADDSSISSLAGYRGALFDILNPTSGNATTLQSIAELDASTASAVIGTNATLLRPLLCLDVSKQVNNVRNVSFTKYLVKFAPPVHHRAMGSVGISALGTSPYQAI